MHKYQNDNVLSVKIVSEDDTGIWLEVLEVLRGNETRDTVRLWDGTDFDCNGWVSMAANDLGEVGDTLIIIEPIITEFENSWEVIGDYRRADETQSERILWVEDTRVKGFVKGYYGEPFEYIILETDYEKLVNILGVNGNCYLLTSTEQVLKETDIRVPNPFSETLQVQFGGDYAEMQVRVYAITGQVLHSGVLLTNDLLELPTQDWQTGLYVLELVAENRLLERKKLIKQ